MSSLAKAELSLSLLQANEKFLKKLKTDCSLCALLLPSQFAQSLGDLLKNAGKHDSRYEYLKARSARGNFLIVFNTKMKAAQNREQ